MWILIVLLIVATGVAVAIGAAHKGRRRTRFLQMEDVLALGALAAGDVVSEVFGQTVTNRVWAKYAKGTWVITGRTVDESPALGGFAHGDYTAAEIEECLEAQGMWSQSDKVAQEQGRRKVRRSAIFAGNETEEVAGDGKPIYTKLGFYIEDGETLSMWGRNTGGTVLTTGSSLRFSGYVAVEDR